MTIKELLRIVSIQEVFECITRRYGGKLSTVDRITLLMVYESLKEGSSTPKPGFLEKYQLWMMFCIRAEDLEKGFESADDMRNHFYYYFCIQSQKSERIIHFKKSEYLKEIAELEIPESDLDLSLSILATAAVVGFAPLLGIGKHPEDLIEKFLHKN